MMFPVSKGASVFLLERKLMDVNACRWPLVYDDFHLVDTGVNNDVNSSERRQAFSKCALKNGFR